MLNKDGSCSFDPVKLKKFMDAMRQPHPRRIPPAELDKLRIESAYRALAKRLHPDVGGAEEAMADLNFLVAAARKGIGEQQ